MAPSIITDTIRAQWQSLSDTAQARIRRTRPQLLRRWNLIEEGYEFGTVEADTLNEACDLARETVDTSCYDTSGGTIYADICVRNDVTREYDVITLTVEQDEPGCGDGEDHDWQSPIEVVGGIRENPGVWGHGGGVIIREVCAHCARYRCTNTWAQRRDTGEQGLTEVTYEDADEESLAWIAGDENTED